METEEELIACADRLSDWLRKAVAGAGLGGTVIGISGGVDSALVAALCRRAVGDRALGLIMPCQTNAEEILDARAVAAAAGISVATVALDPVYDAFIGALAAAHPFGAAVDPHAQRMAMANLKPRLRMVTLYYFANRHRLLVVGTGNRAESYVGYSTKYGDGGVDLLPIASLLKREVIAMARALGIPGKILTKPPTAGLWPGQTDESEMGLTYSQLDEYLATGRAPEEIRDRIERMHRASEHKRALPPAPARC
jgi:NAD+ synthase